MNYDPHRFCNVCDKIKPRDGFRWITMQVQCCADCFDKIAEQKTEARKELEKITE